MSLVREMWDDFPKSLLALILVYWTFVSLGVLGFIPYDIGVKWSSVAFLPCSLVAAWWEWRKNERRRLAQDAEWRLGGE